MVMAAKLPVRLRVLVAACENAISGDAFRPGDVLTARDGAGRPRQRARRAEARSLPSLRVGGQS